MKKTILLFIFNVTTLWCQNPSSNAPEVNNIPSSPEAALLGRFGDIPVSYYNGTTDVSIPIYTIKEAGIEIPIVLRYNTSGIKVEDEATWVGLGWDLSPGGAIIQEVRGKRDDDDLFYTGTQPLGYTYMKDKIIQNGSAELYKMMWHFCYSAYPDIEFSKVFEEYPHSNAGIALRTSLENGEGQPDIYHFNFAGYTGKFYINFETGLIEQIDKKYEIRFERSDFNAIRAITQEGHIFHFSTYELAFSYDSLNNPDNKAGKTFRLTTIEFNTGNQINLSYVDVASMAIKYQEKYHIVTNCSEENLNNGLIQQKTVVSNSKLLSQITTKDAIIDFVLEDREDILESGNPTLTTPKRLKRINISSVENPNLKVKSFILNYSYFPYNHIGYPENFNSSNANLSALGKRLKLDSLKEIGFDESQNEVLTKPAYRFEYDMNTTMPLKISCAKDFWGYYNGSNNNTLLPDLEYFDYNYMLKYKQHELTVDGYILFSEPFSYGFYNGVDRFCDRSKVGAYMLKKISYPTGGSTSFEYESNSFTNQFIPDKIKINQSKKLTNLEHRGQGNPQVNYSKSFVLNKSTTINFSNSINDGYTPYNNANAPVYSYSSFSGSKIVFSKVKFIGGQSQTTILKEWVVNNILIVDFEANHGHSWNESIRVDFDPDQSVYYKVEIINTLTYSSSDTYHIAGLKANFYFYDDTGVDTSVSYGGGVRIKSIKNYSENGIPISHKLIKYQDGKLINRFEPLSAREKFCKFAPGTATNGELIVNISRRNTIFISSESLVEGGGQVGYSSVEETELDINQKNNGKKRFQFMNFENITLKDCPSILNPLNGLIVYEEVLDNVGNLKFSKNYSYADLFVGQNKYFYGTVKIHLYSGLESNCSGLIVGVRDYLLVSYPLISTFYKLQSTISVDYFTNGSITKNENYTYNSLGSTSSVTINTSETTETLKTEYLYAPDVTQSNIPLELTERGMTGIPLEVKKYSNSTLLFHEKINYDFFDSRLFPKYFYSKKGVGELERMITYDKYDDKGNLIQYTNEKSIPITIRWNHTKTFPITKIENATYQQVVNSSSLDDLNNVLITRYTYKPLIGITSITDPKGFKTFYEYDSFGRLLNVKDHNGFLISKNEYQYIPQN